MDFTIELEFHGWVNFKFWNQIDEIEIPGSFLSDCIEEMIRKIVCLAEGGNESVITVQTEPGEFRIQFLRSNDECSLKIYEMDDNFSTQDLSQGICVFEDQISLCKLINTLHSELSKLIVDGLDDYKKTWGIEFPKLEFEKLNDAKRKCKVE